MDGYKKNTCVHSAGTLEHKRSLCIQHNALSHHVFGFESNWWGARHAPMSEAYGSRAWCQRERGLVGHVSAPALLVHARR